MLRIFPFSFPYPQKSVMSNGAKRSETSPLRIMHWELYIIFPIFAALWMKKQQYRTQSVRKI